MPTPIDTGKQTRYDLCYRSFKCLLATMNMTKEDHQHTYDHVLYADTCRCHKADVL